MTIEQIKTLINGLKRSIMNAIEQSQEAKDAASDALSTSEQAQLAVGEKMNRINPVGVGSFSMGRKEDTTIGKYSFAMGLRTEASGERSHAEGTDTVASGDYSHAEGNGSIASNNSSHAEGQNTQASGNMSHAEGNYTRAEGSESHAEGNNTKALGMASHAEGNFTEASGYYSHAEGHKTIAAGDYQHVEGLSNLPNYSGTYLHIVGNGNHDGTTRSNAHTLDSKGNAWFQGDVLVGSTSGTNKDDGSVRLAKVNEVILAPVKAEVGQTIVVSAVDENGVPTAWEAVDMVSGGGGENWRLVNSVKLTGDVTTIEFTQDSNGNAFALKKYLVVGIFKGATGNSAGGYAFLESKSNRGNSSSRIAAIPNTVPAASGKRSFAINGELCGRRLKGYFTSSADGTSENHPYTFTFLSDGDYGKNGRNTWNPIADFTISTSGSLGFGSGTYVEVWGVDA